MIGLEFNKEINMYYPIYRKEIPRHEFTLTTAVRHIIESDKVFNWDYIIVDRGYGEGQVEELHRYGIANPKSNFAKKVIGIQYSESVTTIDPFSKKKMKYPMKSFMVLQTALAFEKQKFALIPDDYKLVKRLEEYRVSSRSQYGQPIFDGNDDHLFLAMASAYYGYVKFFSDLMKRKPATKILPIKSPMERASEEHITRAIDEDSSKKKKRKSDTVNGLSFATPQGLSSRRGRSSPPSGSIRGFTSMPSRSSVKRGINR